MCSSINSISSIGFHGSESTGSIAKIANQEPCPTCGRVNFKGGVDTFEKKNSGTSTLAIIAGAGVLTALTIGGLAYANKTQAFNKLKDGKIKDMAMKLKPAAEKCHEWCGTVKTKGTECWNKVKGFFQGNKKS